MGGAGVIQSLTPIIRKCLVQRNEKCGRRGRIQLQKIDFSDILFMKVIKLIVMMFLAHYGSNSSLLW